jgi:hypothetical protein
MRNFINILTIVLEVIIFLLFITISYQYFAYNIQLSNYNIALLIFMQLTVVENKITNKLR